MLLRYARWGLLLGFSIALGAGMGACGSGGTKDSGTSGSSSHASGSGAGTTTGTGGSGGSLFASSSGSTGGAQMQGFDVEPSALQTITVPIGQTTPTVLYKATLNGSPVNAGWSVDQGNLGTVGAGPSSTATFTPTGTTGGLVDVIAGFEGMTVKRQVFIQLTGTQNGSNASNPSEATQIPTMVSQLTAGGGVGGVGGEGLGPAVTDMPTQMALATPSGNGSAQGLTFIYPYDKTVFPRGLLAPLLQWSWSSPGGAAWPGDADAIQIALKTSSGSFSWTGIFGRPPILAQTGGNFTRMPIPEDIWEMATNTAGGTTPNGMPDTLTVSLTVAKNGMGYGPISETWPIAPARLAGIIYYQSYGTQLAHNASGAVGGNGTYGGAVLSIHVGDTGPQLAAGSDAECRVCHSVAAGGSRLVVQQGQNYSISSAYDLAPSGNTEHTLTHEGPWFPGVYPDGSKILTEVGLLLPLDNDAMPLPATGLTGANASPHMPMFSPDGTLVAFNPGTGAQLLVMSYDNTSYAFSNPVTVVDDTSNAGHVPAWPAFFPDSKSIVFHHQSAAGNDGAGDDPVTRGGALAQIDWTDLTSPSDVTPLDNLNGKGYLPKLPAPSPVTCSDDSTIISNVSPDHSDDVDMNYEPTVNPIASGGYAWVVFTSRRMYGSVATIPPMCSDPRHVNLITNITPKKLWVAAVDLGQAAGADSSHPAFYIPGQELLAGNSRGFWTLDPCLADGNSCMTGDQCCNGFCEPGDGGLVCSNTSPGGMCSGLQEKCTTSADCCDPTNLCINGFCTLAGPQ